MNVLTNDLVVNRKFTVEDNIIRISRAYKVACSAFPFNKSILADFQHMKEYGLELAYFAPEYDYKDIQANGFRSVLDAGITLFRLAPKRAGTSNEHDYRRMIRLYVMGIHYAKRMREVTKLDKDAHTDEAISMILDWNQGQEVRSVLYTVAGHFDLGPVTASCYQLYQYYLAMVHVAPSLWAAFRCLFDRDYLVSLRLHSARGSSQAEKKREFAMGDNPLVVALFKNLALTLKLTVSKRDLLIPRQQNLMIEWDPVLKTPELNRYGIKDTFGHVFTRHYKHTDPDTDTVLVYVHGGGYSVGNVYHCEPFLEHLVSRVPNLAVLNLEIALCPEYRFPTQIQQVVDVVTFLANTDEDVLRQIIGFKPKRVILAGDSSGGGTVTSAIVVLNEMRKKWPKDFAQIKLGLFLLYPMLSFSPTLFPSYLIAGMNTFLHAGGYYSVLRGYIPEMEEPEKEEEPQDNKLMAIMKYIFSPTMVPTGTGPYDKSPEEFTKGLNKYIPISRHPFMSIFHYNRLDTMSDIPLYCINASHDGLLDHGVQLCQIWKGPAALDVVHNVQHGFLHLSVINRGQQVYDLMSQRVQDILLK